MKWISRVGLWIVGLVLIAGAATDHMITDTLHAQDPDVMERHIIEILELFCGLMLIAFACLISAIERLPRANHCRPDSRSESRDVAVDEHH